MRCLRLGLVLFYGGAALLLVAMVVMMIPNILLFDLFVGYGRKKFTQN